MQNDFPIGGSITKSRGSLDHSLCEAGSSMCVLAITNKLCIVYRISEKGRRMDDEIRRRKNAFVSGFSGSSIFEIQLVMGVGPAVYLLWKSLRVSASRHWFSQYCIDFAVLGIPCILAQAYSEYNLALIAVAIGTAAFRLNGRNPPRSRQSASSSHLTSLSQSQKPFLATYRAFAMLLTCISILAVDFNVFPRRFVKCETFGTSLMDVGVGSMLVSGGVVAGSRLQGEMGGWKGLIKSAKIAIPVLVLGIARTISVKSVNYQEHVSEYGVHWNFFFTLGFIPITVSLLRLCVPRRVKVDFMFFGLFVGIAYQVLLSLTGLQKWILYAPRTGLLSMNKEGLSSLLGYVSIFLVSVQIGQNILVAPKTKTGQLKKPTTVDFYAKLWRLVLLLALFMAGYCICVYGLDLRVSRRLANLPYIFWVLSMNTAFISLFFLLELMPALPTRIPSLLLAINSNQLFIFLAANILTGLVNLSVDTLKVRNGVAVGILAGYLFVVGLIAVTTHHFGLRIKL